MHSGRPCSPYWATAFGTNDPCSTPSPERLEEPQPLALSRSQKLGQRSRVGRSTRTKWKSLWLVRWFFSCRASTLSQHRLTLTPITMSSPLPSQGDPGHSCQQCAPLNLETIFSKRSLRAFNAGPITRFIGSSCPLARAICLALDLYCGPTWATLSQEQSAAATASAIPDPNLLLKCRTFCQAFGSQELMYVGDVYHARLMMALDSQPS